MSLANVTSRAQSGVDAPPVQVEVHASGGLPAFSIVGLPEAAVRESRDRVRSAILNARFEFPPRRVTVNLAPADLPKEGGRFDLPIALGVLAATGQLDPAALAGHEFLGELALDGRVRPVPGVLPAAVAARDAGATLVAPPANAGQAARLDGLDVLAPESLVEAVAHLAGESVLQPAAAEPFDAAAADPVGDLAEVRGQHQARRALEVAAAGGHNLLMVGEPGTGKSMLASRLPGILPPLTEAEALEVAMVRSLVAGAEGDRAWSPWPPFRAPHHSVSGTALVGGGSHPRPGEISLAHRGVLFLDELPEFERRALEVLREPLETGRITISRAARQAEFPARFQLVAAMNPSPDGAGGDERRAQRYRSRVSGPLLDRIDIQVEVPPVAREDLRADRAVPGESSAAVRERTVAARERQLARQGRPNAHLGPADLDRHCRLGRAEADLLEAAIGRLGLSARARDRILRLARTVADLEGAEAIGSAHLAEAINYRSLDRLYR